MKVVSRSIGSYSDYGLDKTFRLYDWITQVEGKKGGKV